MDAVAMRILVTDADKHVISPVVMHDVRSPKHILVILFPIAGYGEWLGVPRRLQQSLGGCMSELMSGIFLPRKRLGMRDAEQVPRLVRALDESVIVHTPRFFSSKERSELACSHERFLLWRRLGNFLRRL